MSLVPHTDQRSLEWFSAAAEGRLLVQRCRSCAELQFYPRARCASCFSAEVEWFEVSGRGRLHTFSVVHRTPNEEFAADTPYVFAIVELGEGPRLTTRIVGVPFEQLRCEMPVQVTFPDPTPEGFVFPCFTADESAR